MVGGQPHAGEAEQALRLGLVVCGHGRRYRGRIGVGVERRSGSRRRVEGGVRVGAQTVDLVQVESVQANLRIPISGISEKYLKKFPP